MADVTCEVWVLVDAAGDYVVAKEAAEATERYESDVQALSDAEGFRLVKVTVTVPLPEVVELEGTAPPIGVAKLGQLA